LRDFSRARAEKDEEGRTEGNLVDADDLQSVTLVKPSVNMAVPKPRLRVT